MLLAGDVGTNLMGLGDPVGFENLEEGRASQRKIASLSYDGAGFGHGEPIVRDASTRFRDKWAPKKRARNRPPEMRNACFGPNSPLASSWHEPGQPSRSCHVR